MSCLPGGVAAGIHGIASVWRAALGYVPPDVAPDVAALALTHGVAPLLKCAPLLPSDTHVTATARHMQARITWHIFKLALNSRIRMLACTMRLRMVMRALADQREALTGAAHELLMLCLTSKQL